MNFEEYISYFKSLTEQHSELQHKEESPVFLPINMEEALGYTRTSIKSKSYALQLYPYSSSLDGNYNATNARQHEGGFYMLKYHKDADYNQALVDTEKVALDFIHKMIADSNEGHNLWQHSLNSNSSFTITPSIRERGLTYSGYLVTFTWKSVSANCSEWPSV